MAQLQARGALRAPLAPMGRSQLDRAVRECSSGPGSALVIGARGRSGRGAVDALAGAGWDVTKWGLVDTADLDKDALLGHELLVNCVVTHRPQEPFVTGADIGAQGRHLRVIGDVTCDVTSANNVLPINTSVTTWDTPARQVGSPSDPLDVIAIDNLPSLLPLDRKSVV